MIKMTEFAKRRDQLMKKIGPKGVIILPSASLVTRNSDNDYAFRQNSDFYYLTGFGEPDAILVLLPRKSGGDFILFNRERIREEEIWTGFRAGQKGACEVFGAHQAYSIGDFEKKLPELLEGREEIHYTLGLNPSFEKLLFKVVNKIRRKIRNGVQAPLSFFDIEPSLHEMRLIKSPAEIALMRKAAEISADAHIRAMQVCKPGMNEYQLEAEIVYEFQRNGARFSSYNPIIGSGANACILHYISNNKIIKDGELILIDAGCEYENYAADITRTFPANGRFTGEQRAIYEIVLAAQLAGIKAVRKGAAFSAYHTKVIEVITQGLIEVGILKGRLQDLIEKQAYFPFYMHKAGHWLGLDVHDVGRYKVGEKWRSLQPGMVLTVEPGIYISADTPNVHKRWHNMGIRIEDDVLVTEKGNDILSSKVPKTIADIEALMRHR